MSKFRAKIGATAVIAIALVTLLLNMLVIPRMLERSENQTKDAVMRAKELVMQSQRLASYDLVSSAMAMTNHKELRKAVFSMPPSWHQGISEKEVRERRLDLFSALTGFDEALKANKGKADFVAVLDMEGRQIVRDLDFNDHSDKIDLAAVKDALEGEASSAFWFHRNKMMRAAAAPFVYEGEVRGVAVIAYEFNAKDAREEYGHFGTHVAYFVDNAVRASSFSEPGAPDKEDAAMVSALGKQVLGNEVAAKAITGQEASEVITLELQGESYVAVAGPLPSAVTFSGRTQEATKNENKFRSGYVVLSSMTKATSLICRAQLFIVAFGVIAIVLILGFMWLTARHFIEAEDRLELGVNEIINGNIDYVFEDQEEFEGLANALNVMLARLLGRPEPGEDTEEGQPWRADVIFVDEADATEANDAESAALAAEAEATYLQRLFNEYMNARTQNSMPTDGITLESFSQKIKANEALLKAKHKCRMVRFAVRAAGGKVSLKPIRIG